jgi:hypothetical protein
MDTKVVSTLCCQKHELNGGVKKLKKLLLWTKNLYAA